MMRINFHRPNTCTEINLFTGYIYITKWFIYN